MAENVEIEHPYAPDGPLRIVGRAALVAHMRDAIAQFTIEHAATRYVYHCEPRGAVIVEFDLAVRRSGKEYKQQCVAIIETSGGRITRYREYWNPLATRAPDEEAAAGESKPVRRDCDQCGYVERSAFAK